MSEGFITRRGGVSGAANPIEVPTNVSPANGATDVEEEPTLVASAFTVVGETDTHAASQFRIYEVTTGDLIHDSGALGPVTQYEVPQGVLDDGETEYEWEVCYVGLKFGPTEFSARTSFTTVAAFSNFISTPTATPANFGDALEGGFYTGMIWNQVTQSATSTAIGTGSKTFTVTDDMAITPLFYAGQTVEVRSRANPATQRMIGTITSAIGTTLTVNVTSVNGSGTYTDWSVMARYRVIVAPKSSGENASVAYKNANTAAPSGTHTLTEGLKATLAMVAADTSTVYPAAHWANNLTINTYSDWYMPARDELELCWRNLKPVTNNNYTTADRPTAFTPNYTNLGSIGTSGNQHGVNLNSSPQGAAYTTTVPGQTAATAFRTGGAEAFEFGSAVYISSTEYSASAVWRQAWSTNVPGGQANASKSVALQVRAVRRSII